MRNWEVVLRRISEKILPSASGYVRRLYSVTGFLVNKIVELRNGDYYVATIGQESFKLVTYGMLNPPLSRKFANWTLSEFATPIKRKRKLSRGFASHVQKQNLSKGIFEANSNLSALMWRSENSKAAKAAKTAKPVEKAKPKPPPQTVYDRLYGLGNKSKGGSQGQATVTNSKQIEKTKSRVEVKKTETKVKPEPRKVVFDRLYRNKNMLATQVPEKKPSQPIKRGSIVSKKLPVVLATEVPEKKTPQPIKRGSIASKKLPVVSQRINVTKTPPNRTAIEKPTKHRRNSKPFVILSMIETDDSPPEEDAGRGGVRIKKGGLGTPKTALTTRIAGTPPTKAVSKPKGAAAKTIPKPFRAAQARGRAAYDYESDFESDVELEGNVPRTKGVNTPYPRRAAAAQIGNSPNEVVLGSDLEVSRHTDSRNSYKRTNSLPSTKDEMEELAHRVSLSRLSRDERIWNELDEYYDNQPLQAPYEEKGQYGYNVAYYPPNRNARQTAGHDSGKMHSNTLLSEQEKQKGIFTVNDQMGKSNGKVKEINFDEDSSGFYRAKLPRMRDNDAREVNESDETVIDLPIDSKTAEEINEEEIIPLTRKPARELNANICTEGTVSAQLPTVEIEVDGKTHPPSDLYQNSSWELKRKETSRRRSSIAIPSPVGERSKWCNDMKKLKVRLLSKINNDAVQQKTIFSKDDDGQENIDTSGFYSMVDDKIASSIAFDQCRTHRLIKTPSDLYTNKKTCQLNVLHQIATFHSSDDVCNPNVESSSSETTPRECKRNSNNSDMLNMLLIDTDTYGLESSTEAANKNSFVSNFPSSTSSTEVTELITDFSRSSRATKLTSSASTRDKSKNSILSLTNMRSMTDDDNSLESITWLSPSTPKCTSKSLALNHAESYSASDFPDVLLQMNESNAGSGDEAGFADSQQPHVPVKNPTPNIARCAPLQMKADLESVMKEPFYYGIENEHFVPKERENLVQSQSPLVINLDSSLEAPKIIDMCEIKRS